MEKITQSYMEICYPEVVTGKAKRFKFYKIDHKRPI